MRARAIRVCVILSLTACSPMPPIPPAIPAVQIQRMEIPVPIPCKPALAPSPPIPSRADILDAPDHFERTKRIVQAYVLLSARNDQLEAAIFACEGR